MLKVGPNPYGICTTLGIQGYLSGPRDASWFVGLAESMRASCIEFHFLHLAKESAGSISDIQSRLQSASIEPVISGPWPISRIHEAFPLARQLNVRTIRTHLSPILCGARAAEGDHWSEIVASIRASLPMLGRRFADEGLTLAIENHQDFGSDELLEFCDLGGSAVGICLDTGNPLAVGETPLAFTAKVASNVRHIHLKDYQAQPTIEGFRLVRCAIGDGAIPFVDIEKILSSVSSDMTATLEPGALEARHIKLLTKEWQKGYRSISESDIEACIQATRQNALLPEADYRTPREYNASPEQISEFEMDQMTRSIQYMKTIGWLQA